MDGGHNSDDGLTGRLAARFECEAWRPRLFRLGQAEDRKALSALLDQQPGLHVFDVIEEQLIDLMKTRHPALRLSDKAARDLVLAQLGDTPRETYGVWVYYPWSQRLVHLLDEAEFVELRTNRNKYKLTADEQARLATRKVGVVGLSVGSAVATTMALERSVGEIRLADFDRLDLSNLNRIRSGVHNLGISKVLITAREIAEIDPFLKIVLFPVGLHDENINAFILRGGKLDVLIDECDSIDIKLKLRVAARMHRIPVVMETSDRSIIDIERFDLEPTRPIFHGLVGDIDPERLANLSTEEKIPYVLKIIGAETMSARMVSSMLEIESSIKTWPQLGSCVVYGGGATADIVRRINLNHMDHSGRFYIDLEEVVPNRAPGSGPAEPPFAPPLLPPPPSRERMLAASSRVDSARGPDEAPLSDEDVQILVTAGAQAPSGGNAQPWMWFARAGRLFLFHDRSRSEGLTDFRASAGFVALGAALENVCLAAHARGLAVAVELFPAPDEPDLVAVFRGLSRPGAAAEPREWGHLAPLIHERHTNRRNPVRRPLDPSVVDALVAAARSIPGAELHLVQGEDELAEIGQIIGANDRLRLLNPTLAYEMFREVRWNDDDAARTRDGLHVDSLEMSASDRAGMEMCRRRDAIDFLRTIRGGRGFEKSAAKALAAASAFGLVTMSGTAPRDYLLGGRAVQRVWLTANSRGVAFQPISTLAYFFARLIRGGGEGLDELTVAELQALRPRYTRVFPVRDDQAEVLLFRLTQADPPTLRSLRRPLAEILHTAED